MRTVVAGRDVQPAPDTPRLELRHYFATNQWEALWAGTRAAPPQVQPRLDLQAAAGCFSLLSPIH